MRGAVWEAEEGIYYWYRYPWPVGREDLLVLYSLRLRKDNKIKIKLLCMYIVHFNSSTVIRLIGTVG